jgi:3-polyprenyl-4-hydroxybenzoate decarboxylase
MSMKRYAGEARHEIPTTIASSQRPKKVVVVDPDIDVRNPDQVEWAITFRTQPARDVIIIDGLPGGTLDPSLDGSLPLDRRVGSAMGIDTTFPLRSRRTEGRRRSGRRGMRPGGCRAGPRVLQSCGCARQAGLRLS